MVCELVCMVLRGASYNNSEFNLAYGHSPHGGRLREYCGMDLQVASGRKGHEVDPAEGGVGFRAA